MGWKIIRRKRGRTGDALAIPVIPENGEASGRHVEVRINITQSPIVCEVFLVYRFLACTLDSGDIPQL